MNQFVLGIAAMVIFVFGPMLLLKAYLSEQENKDLRKRLGREQ